VVEIREIGEKRTIYGWKAVTTRDARWAHMRVTRSL